MRFSVLADFVCGFAVLDEIFFGFAVSSIPQCPPLGIRSWEVINSKDTLHMELKHWFEEGSTNDEAEKANPTLIRPFVHKWKQHYAACPFESYLPVEG